MTDRPQDNRAGGIEALYPFLYADRGGIDSLLAEVAASTGQKAREIVALRDVLLDQIGDRLIDCAAAMARSFAAGGKLLAFGNGGSATDAAAIAHAFMHPHRGRPLPAISLGADTAVITALGNDVGFEIVFARQLAAFARPHDIALGISTSGNSANLLRALDEAGRRGLLTVGLAGYDGGKMARAAAIDFLFVAPSPSVHRIQEGQTTIYHLLSELVRLALEKQEAS